MHGGVIPPSEDQVFRVGLQVCRGGAPSRHQPFERLQWPLHSALPAARVELNRPTLEEVFIRIVTQGVETGAEDLAKLRASLREDTGAGEAS